MKLSLRLARRAGLVLLAASASAFLLGSASCAESDGETFAPPVDNSDATLPPPVEGDAGPDAAPPVEAGTRTCSDDGFCHTVLPAGQTLRGVWGDGAGTVWTVSSEGSILRWDGNAWSVHAAKLGALYTVWGSSPTDVWVGGELGVYHGTGASSSALTFALQALPGDITVKVTGIWGLSANDVWAVGTMAQPDAEPLGRVLHFTGGADGGAGTWSLDVASDIGVKWVKVWGNAGSGVWLSGDRFMPEEFFDETVVYRRAVGSSAFVDVALPPVPDQVTPFNKVGALFGGLVFGGTSVVIAARSLGGASGRWIGTSADAGKTFTWTFTKDALPLDPPLVAAAGSAANDFWTVGEYGRVFHWNGTVHAPAAVTVGRFPVIDPFYAVWSKSPSETWIVGKNQALRLDPSKNKDGGAL